MADKNWQAGGGITIPARVVACLLATVVPFGAARAAVSDSGLVLYPAASGQLVWEMALGGIVLLGFVVSVGVWVLSMLRGVERSRQRRNASVSSALNNLKQGVVIANPRQRIVFLNDRYLEIYGLSRADITPNMTGRELLELRIKSGALNLSADDFFALAGRP